MHKFNTGLQTVENRVDHFEIKMTKFATTINYLVDVHDNNKGEMKWAKAKLADIEDRSRYNNEKIRGIPEYVQNADLRTYVTDMFTKITPDLTAIDLTMDRIHHLPKPSHLPDNVHRDVILCLHFYHVKERMMSAKGPQKPQAHIYSISQK